MSEDLAGEHRDAAALAVQAGRALMELREAPPAGTRDLGAAGDHMSHHLLVSELNRLYPGDLVRSEEGLEHVANDGRLWIVDPLDGTREFLACNGEFTVNIALIENHAPVLGVVHVPVSDTTYRGGTGEGAWRQRATDRAQALGVAARAGDPVRVVGSRSHRGDSLAGFLGRLGSHELKSVGSSLKLCMIAEGSADVYPRLGSTSEWDTAAAHAVVSAAGGVVVELNGEPLRYNTRESLLNPFFVAYGDPGRDWLALLR